MIEIPSDFSEQTAKFTQILTKFNRVHSLTNYKNFDEQIADSIKPLAWLKFYPKTAIDVGSGAGFPAIFLAMILKDCQWWLFEPNAKKSSFLSYIKAELNLQNVNVKSCKIEAYESFVADLITSRALMKTKELLKICRGFYNDETQILLYKGSSVEGELGGLSAQIYGEQNRNYVFIEGRNAL